MLDLAQAISLITAYASNAQRSAPARASAQQEALRRLAGSAAQCERIGERIRDARTSWLLAGWLTEPDSAIPAPAFPLPASVIAVDGSQIVGDRHEVASCCLINTGTVIIRYGSDERPVLESAPVMLDVEDGAEWDAGSEERGNRDSRVGIERTLAEYAAMAAAISAESGYRRSGGPAAITGFLDGSLILWSLEQEHPVVAAAALERAQASLETARLHSVPVAGYISASGSRDVVNSLRVAVCPHEAVNCDRFCPDRAAHGNARVTPPCAGVEQITDADLFGAILNTGERSAVFESRSKILRKYNPPHRVLFFYLNTGREIARVEIPAWVAESPSHLHAIHAACADQARKGDGYPVALAEAHEQAVVRLPERAAFFQLMERALVGGHLPVSGTRKAASKHARRV